MPAFMDSVWFKGNDPEAQKQQQWFITMGSGVSPRHLDLPIAITKGMVHHFLHSPAEVTVETACRTAQVLSLGGSKQLAEALLGSKLATDFSHAEFWSSVIRWLIASKMQDFKHVAPLVDYIYHQKFASPSDADREPAEPDFSIEGQTPDSVLMRMRQWHTDLRKKTVQADVSWYECGIPEFDWIQPFGDSEGSCHWTIREIVTRSELHAEGCDMRHCVAIYETLCVRGKSAIWSLGVERNNGSRKRVLTVEVAVGRKSICQVRGKANRLPTEKEMDILRRWAAQERLGVDATVRTR
jgi:hypothetical protein